VFSEHRRRIVIPSDTYVAQHKIAIGCGRAKGSIRGYQGFGPAKTHDKELGELNEFYAEMDRRMDAEHEVERGESLATG
jgi:hypothetical protein